MAIVEITNTKLERNVAAELVATVAVDATDGAAIDFDNKSDGRILVILENGAAEEKTATIKAGNGLQGTEDLVVTLTANQTQCVVVESGKFKNVSGENKGKVIVTGADVKVAAVELP